MISAWILLVLSVLSIVLMVAKKEKEIMPSVVATVFNVAFIVVSLFEIIRG